MLKRQDGFTLLEMLIVLFIIAILLLIILPNVAQHFATIDKKGCDAHIAMVQGQVEAYRIDHITYPTLQQLVAGKYINEHHEVCPDGRPIKITADGTVALQ